MDIAQLMADIKKANDAMEVEAALNSTSWLAADADLMAIGEALNSASRLAADADTNAASAPIGEALNSASRQAVTAHQGLPPMPTTLLS
jgi:hypothetical protein